ncbi:hypothetical protein [Alphaspiravirus yamagawaense]|uniref:Uncharacterized protein n=1 Tax=Alphaspiravirus yamagawaense TaxID=1157339 RepID=J7Q325_9VIRU|nr:hypothetical protein [Aeropyrum coil-shaped virus]CCG27833.1 hypothetical protein [Aeropyrum coil-shaped virus]
MDVAEEIIRRFLNIVITIVVLTMALFMFQPLLERLGVAGELMTRAIVSAATG